LGPAKVKTGKNALAKDSTNTEAKIILFIGRDSLNWAIFNLDAYNGCGPGKSIKEPVPPKSGF
jgi:hypothetical protein